ncbi:hypothetical protein TraAM80_02924 [Trypanosoma rangeli]|uniref:Uncharacterized protein n=1 Tax=Trypanosoma rangeli TaxID=5698 RepID=A0A3R7NVE2_TRYRA|nr:uncharacterized protein TraAM80_02924 [Trypanosoma rangeli]RNF08334.1 hypothetical protein TraAM80_02924 [Trypanosoma rangeli]|eukprot:RNF08334.1 hypothetical protein TraAM80_02924 [Trypanosoma rangeli]
MVLGKGPPFRLTLHLCIADVKAALAVPLSITATVADNELQHCLDFCVPSGPEVEALEITNVEFLFQTEAPKGNLRKSCRTASCGGLQGYLFMQLLDHEAHPSGHPFAIVCCDTEMGNGIYSRVKLPLPGGQSVRFYLVERKKQGEEKIGINSRIVGVRFTGMLRLSSGGVGVKSGETRKQIQALTETSLTFRADSCGRNMLTSTGSRYSPSSHCQEGEKSAKGRLRSDEGEPTPTESVNGDADEEPPNLIYAFVSGGDYES